MQNTETKMKIMDIFLLDYVQSIQDPLKNNTVFMYPSTSGSQCRSSC